MSFFGKIAAGSYGPAQSVGNDGLFVRMLGHTKTETGVYVSENTAINLPAVYNAVGIIADGLAMLPIDVFQRRANGAGHDEVKEHNLPFLLNEQPNPNMVAFTMRQTKAFHQILWGNGYAEIERTGGGDVNGLYPLLPDRTAPIKPAGGELRYQSIINGETIPINKDNVLHNPALGFDGYVGYSPVAIARQAIGLGLAMETFGSKFFANDAKSGGFLMHPGKLGDEGSKNLRDSVESNKGLNNAHRIRVLEEGMKFVSTTIPPEDAQFLGSREFQISEIARIFRVPLFLLQSTEKSTTWGTGLEQMMLGFLTWTLQPWITREEQELNKKLLTTEEREKGLFLKMNVNAIMRTDMSGRGDFYQKGIAAGWLAPNEAREKENLNPIDGLDQPLRPLNMTTAGDDNNSGIVEPEPNEEDS